MPHQWPAYDHFWLVCHIFVIQLAKSVTMGRLAYDERPENFVAAMHSLSHQVDSFSVLCGKTMSRLIVLCQSC